MKTTTAPSLEDTRALIESTVSKAVELVGENRHGQSTVHALQHSLVLWDNEVEECTQKGKTHKVYERFSSTLNFQVRHSTAAASNGYAAILRLVSIHI